MAQEQPRNSHGRVGVYGRPEAGTAGYQARNSQRGGSGARLGSRGNSHGSAIEPVDSARAPQTQTPPARGAMGGHRYNRGGDRGVGRDRVVDLHLLDCAITGRCRQWSGLGGLGNPTRLSDLQRMGPQEGNISLVVPVERNQARERKHVLPGWHSFVGSRASGRVANRSRLASPRPRRSRRVPRVRLLAGRNPARLAVPGVRRAIHGNGVDWVMRSRACGSGARLGSRGNSHGSARGPSALTSFSLRSRDGCAPQAQKDREVDGSGTGRALSRGVGKWCIIWWSGGGDCVGIGMGSSHLIPHHDGTDIPLPLTEVPAPATLGHENITSQTMSLSSMANRRSGEERPLLHEFGLISPRVAIAGGAGFFFAIITKSNG